MDKKPLIGEQPPPYPGAPGVYPAGPAQPSGNQHDQPPPYYNGAFAPPPAGWTPAVPPPPPPNYGSTIVIEPVSVSAYHIFIKIRI